MIWTPDIWSLNLAFNQSAPDFYIELAPSEMLLHIMQGMEPSVSARGHYAEESCETFP